MIRTGYKSKEEPARWTPEDSVIDHRKMLDYVDHVTRDPGSYVVVGHHCPSELSVAAQYKGNLLNAAFRSGLDAFIEARPQIRLWLHGHTHYNFNYWIGETRVVCNPRGYIGHESSADWFKLQYLEV
jgi:Icc-related predicted phosphoesterase